MRGAAGEHSWIGLRLHLPLCPGLRAGDGGGAGSAADRRQRWGDRGREGSQREDCDVGGRLRRRRAEQRVERLEKHFRSGDEPDPAYAQPNRPHPALRRQQHPVARLRLQGRSELLVEHDLARPLRTTEEAERVQMCEVARRDREDRARPGADRSHRRRSVLEPGEGRGRGRHGLRDARLARDAGRDACCGAITADRSLPVERHASDGRPGHRAEGVADEEEHRPE